VGRGATLPRSRARSDEGRGERVLFLYSQVGDFGPLPTRRTGGAAAGAYPLGGPKPGVLGDRAPVRRVRGGEESGSEKAARDLLRPSVRELPPPPARGLQRARRDSDELRLVAVRRGLVGAGPGSALGRGARHRAQIEDRSGATPFARHSR